MYDGAMNLPGAKPAVARQIEPVTPDIAESAEQMAAEDISVEDAPF